MFIENNLIINSPTILVVDDIELNTKLINTLLKRILPKANLIESKNGELAIKNFNLHKPDLVFMDIEMPIMDGYTATKEIRKLEQENGKRTPIIAITALNSQAAKDKCFEVSMDEHIPKPVNRFVLQEILKKYLHIVFNEENCVATSSELINKSNTIHFDPKVLLRCIGKDKFFLENLFQAYFDEMDKFLSKLSGDNQFQPLSKEFFYLINSMQEASLQLGFVLMYKYFTDLYKTDNKDLKKAVDRLVKENKTIKKLSDIFLEEL